MVVSDMVKSALKMFFVLATELTTLFLLVSYLVAILQDYIPPAKIQKILSAKKGRGYILAGLFGAITPFCSCSTIPFLKGLLRAKAGFGVTMVFLFSSPLLNPVIIGLFAVTFGIKVTIFYFIMAMGIAIIAGILLEKLGFEKYVKPEFYEAPKAKGCGAQTQGAKKPAVNKWKKAWFTAWTDFKQVFPYLLIGIAIGAIIYGFMPQEIIARFANDHNPFAVPIAAVIGIPLYIRAEAVIPLSFALVQKGMGLGAVMALIIGSAGASLTEVILLKSIFKVQMIIAFLAVVLFMAVSSGYLYTFLFAQ